VKADATKPGSSPAPETASDVPYQTISSAGPLESIFLGVDASAQIAYAGEVDYQVYPPSTVPGDYGSFIATGGALYAPDFENHGGTATDLGTYTPFTPVSQSEVLGSGTSADPYQVVTVVDVGATGLRLTQTDSYVVGEESYRTDVQISNSANTGQDIILYRAMDCYLGGSDSGYGAVDPITGAVACTETANNNPAARIEQLLPLTGGSSYYEDRYSEVWEWIATQQPFPNTCECDVEQDNGSGISWSTSVPAGGSITRSHLTTFSPLGNLPLGTMKIADAGTSQPGAANGYTITITNPNTTAVTLNSITDVLPEGFSYIAGSTTGATVTDPAISGQMLTWNGPFTVPASASVTLHFNVAVATTPGTYFNNATAAAEGFTVSPTGDTAPITVEQATSVTLDHFGSQPGRGVAPWFALALAGLVAAAGIARRNSKHPRA
jgi:uncharacterized repeat protein (TIGR01451 family)